MGNVHENGWHVMGEYDRVESVTEWSETSLSQGKVTGVDLGWF